MTIKLNVGDKVRVRETVAAYYSNYGGKPELLLTPEIVGVVGAVRVPYVRATKDRTRGDYFTCIDFTCPASGQIERAGVRYDNLVIVAEVRIRQQYSPHGKKEGFAVDRYIGGKWISIRTQLTEVKARQFMSRG